MDDAHLNHSSGSNRFSPRKVSEAALGSDEPFFACLFFDDAVGAEGPAWFPTILSRQLSLRAVSLSLEGSLAGAPFAPESLEFLNKAEFIVAQVVEPGVRGSPPACYDGWQSIVLSRLFRKLTPPRILHWVSFDGLSGSVKQQDRSVRKALSSLTALCDATVHTALQGGGSSPDSSGRRGAGVDVRHDLHERLAADLLKTCRRFGVGARAGHGGRNAADFVLFSAERTGSNLLSGMMGDHGRIHMGGELFNRHMDHIQLGIGKVCRDEGVISLRNEEPRKFLDRFFDGDDKAGKITGFKMMYGHLASAPGFFEFVRNRALKVVHLKRRNWVKRFVSQKMAATTGVWVVGSGDTQPPQPKVHIMREEVFFWVDQVAAQEEAVMAACTDSEMLELYYEDLVANTDRVIARVFRFLGVEPIAVKPRYLKQSSDDLRDSVDNIGELREFFLRLASCVDEE